MAAAPALLSWLLPSSPPPPHAKARASHPAGQPPYAAPLGGAELDELDFELHRAATRIQGCYRRHRVRRTLMALASAMAQIQAAARGRLARRRHARTLKGANSRVNSRENRRNNSQEDSRDNRRAERRRHSESPSGRRAGHAHGVPLSQAHADNRLEPRASPRGQPRPKSRATPSRPRGRSTPPKPHTSSPAGSPPARERESGRMQPRQPIQKPRRAPRSRPRAAGGTVGSAAGSAASTDRTWSAQSSSEAPCTSRAQTYRSESEVQLASKVDALIASGWAIGV